LFDGVSIITGEVFERRDLTPVVGRIFGEIRPPCADRRAAVAVRFLQHVSRDEAVVIEEALRRVRDEHAG
jgi:hypothetical protein